MGDTMTSYGTASLWPFVKRHVKLNIILGIDPLTIIVSCISLPLLYSAYENSNLSLFNLVYLLAAIFFIAYLSIRITLKSIIYFKFHIASLPMFNFFKYKIVYDTQFSQGGQEYKELKWQTYNLLTGSLSAEERFTYPLMDPVPPLDSDEKMIAYSHKIVAQKRFLLHSKYHICEILSRNEDGAVILWYSLELGSGKYKMGTAVTLKRDGTYELKDIYPTSKIQ
jgi:hypothetical protein